MFPDVLRHSQVKASLGALVGLLRVFVGMSFAFLSATSIAGVYKCEDSAGQIAYQATPCANTSKQSEMEIRATRPDYAQNEAPRQNSSGTGSLKKRAEPEYPYVGSGEPQINIINKYGGWEPVSLSKAEEMIAQWKNMLKQATECDEEREKRIDQWEKRKQEKIQEAIAECRRKRNSYCDTRDPEKILRLYTLRNDPRLDVPNNPFEANKRIAEVESRREMDDKLTHIDMCPGQDSRDEWQRKIEKYEKAVAEVKQKDFVL
ncbi:DUF4124 domain-containing protein [Marinobacter sp. NFXS9]|uniref:DUF4124 domain-containing protein n=1 Tax=Marinobacter sp. NFXS9 TaxID=2818433 RepID=UPI0032DE4971